MKDVLATLLGGGLAAPIINKLLNVRTDDGKEAQSEEEEREKTIAAMRKKRMTNPGMAKGGKVKPKAKGGSVSKRADGCAQRGKTKGRMV
jgi:hypothetical protein